MTGYSQKYQPKQELIDLVFEHVTGANKDLTFVMSRLRSGKDILKKGGDVTSTFTEMKYSFDADSKRLFIQNEDGIVSS
jgi:hypothetical protein